MNIDKNIHKETQVLSSSLVKYMDDVVSSRESLENLSRKWDTLSLLSQLGDAGINMERIKNDFGALSSELVNYLSGELLEKITKEMDSKAQVSVDIVIRNLFERTADIGFLSIDSVIKEFLQKYQSKYEPGYKESAELLNKRFMQYAQKYSVYSDIILMNPEGGILAKMSTSCVPDKSNDSILKQVINTNEEYVETYKYHDFLPQYEKSLVYSYKVTHSNDFDEDVLGILCLCFKFEDEMEGIFQNIINSETKECLTLLDDKGYVIATSDKYHIPIGAPLEIVLNEPYKIITFGGRDYFVKSAKTNGYQGFFGLGWYGHIMIPIEHAFNAIDKEEFEVTQELLLAILQHSDLFSEQLKQIPLQAEKIQDSLSRAIWNGHIKQTNSTNDNQQFSKALLQEMYSIGEHTKHIIGKSMAELTKTMVLSDSVFLADLILDIMDRNLYERANDCRWWALTPDFRTILDSQSVDAYDKVRMNTILTYINNLYTVYTNLFVYDKDGVIIAVSKTSEEYLIGTKLSNRWVEETLLLDDVSKYCVSDFEKSPLYDNQHTYIYNAAIRSLIDDSKVVGGIGIVFDSKLQFKQMIEESLPKQDEEESSNALFSVLTTKNQVIISSNDLTYNVGDFFDIDKKFFSLKNGDSLSEIINYRGNYYALGVKCSKGYREYKSSQDDYVNDVYNFVFSYISNVEETKLKSEEKNMIVNETNMISNNDTLEVATFIIGSKRLAIKTEDIVESINIVALDSTVNIGSDHHFKGTIIYNDCVVSVIDIQQFVQETSKDPYEEIIIVKYGTKGYIGILANSLSSIPSVDINNIKPLDEYIIGNGTLIQSIVFPSKNDPSQEALSILNIEKIHTNLVEENLSHMNKKIMSPERQTT